MSEFLYNLLSYISTHQLESLGFVSGILNVWLTARANVWCWLVGLINVVAYFFVFLEAKLYADMSLQVLYFVLTLYGWYEWLRGGENKSELPVSKTPSRIQYIALLAILLLWLPLWYILHRFTDASLPSIDSLLTAASIVATWLMARKYLECWLWWILIDALYVPMFIYKQLYVSAGLYALFLVLALMGYYTWRKEYTSSTISSINQEIATV